MKEMPKKTDAEKKRRCRVRYACKPELEQNLLLVNSFPELSEWKEFDQIRPTADNPIAANPESIKLYPKEMSLHFDKKRRESAAKIARAFSLLYFLRTLPEIALNSIIFPNEIAELTRLGKERTSLANLPDKPVEVDPYIAFLSNKSKRFPKQFSESYSNKMLVDKLQIQKKLNGVVNEIVLINNRWFRRYQDIKSYKLLLERVSFIGRNPKEAKRNISDLIWTELWNLTPNVFVDDEGKLQKKDNFFLESLIGIDVTRIKRCRICQNFFWANRTDRQCCSEKCANVYNKRKSRENKQTKAELYKKARQKRTKKTS